MDKVKRYVNLSLKKYGEKNLLFSFSFKENGNEVTFSFAGENFREEIFFAQVCQQNRKALMTNPNKALSDWLLRGVFQVKELELLTIEKMNRLGFDSVIIYKDEEGKYRIDKAKVDSYENFIGS